MVGEIVEIDGPPLEYHVELLRGRTFWLVRFEESVFHDDHAHCVRCGQKIAEAAWPEVEHDGYVTPFALGPDVAQGTVSLRWICRNCFGVCRARLNWNVANDPLPTFSQDRYPPNIEPALLGPASKEHGDAYPQPVIRVEWAAGEIMSIARSVGAEMDELAALKFLARHKRIIEGSMTGAAYHLILRLLEKRL
jgi:hypothetical protein